MARQQCPDRLRMLRHLGVVTGPRAGRAVVYALVDNHVAMLLDAAAPGQETGRGQLSASPVALRGGPGTDLRDLPQLARLRSPGSGQLRSAAKPESEVDA